MTNSEPTKLSITFDFSKSIAKILNDKVEPIVFPTAVSNAAAMYNIDDAALVASPLETVSSSYPETSNRLSDNESDEVVEHI